MSNSNKKDFKLWGSLLVFIIPIVLGSLYYHQLPDEMAVHFNTQNVADDFAPKWFALFGIPVLLMLVHGLTIFFIQNDPKKQGHPKVLKALLYWLIPVVTLIVQITIITYSLGHTFNITNYVSAGVGILIVILGNYLPKSRQNYSVGIKLPWTLSSEENWNKTHHMAGKLWIVSGILLTLSALLGYYAVFLLVLLIMVLVPCIYSYTLYKKDQSTV